MEHHDLVSFKLDAHDYAIPVAQVVEVVRMVALTPLPKAMPGIEAVFNLRGTVIPVIDIRRCLELPPRKHDLNTRLLIVRVASQLLAFPVDEATDVVALEAAAIEAPYGVAPKTPHLAGVGKAGERLILILDLEDLFAGLETGQLDTALGETPVSTKETNT